MTRDYEDLFDYLFDIDLWDFEFDYDYDSYDYVYDNIIDEELSYINDEFELYLQ